MYRGPRFLRSETAVDGQDATEAKEGSVEGAATPHREFHDREQSPTVATLRSLRVVWPELAVGSEGAASSEFVTWNHSPARHI